MRRVLLIAYHFPPFTGSSGVQRALRFACHLPEFGWEPIVLTANPRAYERRSDDLLKELPEEVTVIRAPAWDAKRHFSIGGRYPGFLSRPDRWRSWRPGAVLAGLRAIKKYKPDAIWSTFPIATAHSIGAALARKSGLPWIADFRDPMAQDGYPSDPSTWRSYAYIERLTVSRATFSVFTTPGTLQLYRERYPQLEQRFELLENGYDEGVFAQAKNTGSPLNPEKLTLLHSGVVYPKERDPSFLFEAMNELREKQPHVFSRIVIRFRAPGHEEFLRNLVRTFLLEDNVEILPMVSSQKAIEEMLRADGLMILQGSSCNDQIPAKFYEYLRSGSPILVLSDQIGDTAGLARTAGVSAIAGLENRDDIAAVLAKFAKDQTEGTLASEKVVKSFSRRSRASELATLFEQATETGQIRNLIDSDYENRGV